MQQKGSDSLLFKTLQWLLHCIFSLFVLLSSLWLCLALWIQQPIHPIVTYGLIIAWACFSLSILGIYFSQHLISRNKDILLYVFGFFLALGWYFGLDARQDRDWNPEVSRLLSYQIQGNQVTLDNVRDFHWYSDGSYEAAWQTRVLDLNQITGVNIITSYWTGPQIAHTLVSFDFANQAPLTFSIEIRKEQGEDFSAIGGFFRKYELNLVAANETDIIYTRSNIRHEQVYFFPIKMSKSQSRALFLEYLNKANELAQQPKWYNTLSSNCTTLVFDMIQEVSQKPLPVDYRLLASGYLPNYLYDLDAISHRYSLHEWYRRAHVNPKVQSLTSVQDYSSTIRQGLPTH
ncbi:lipoprotein N-acyltransferase Lnb domain-containing protein [Acinetobacter zhairhuonensis]|uniref:lipoprotein N-acyltransferase Lnb domain-containing protein n=1 Tax=Acinetobacter sp. A7.4 TaxID=2919921 RepID=UPI001F4EE4AF|nr:DUF4105 domain-containing protein [Acinetobacter sp. A7.4]MCJ8161028.1 DUF4105 domain-containing protein [Acinetobacter sp. A7.4]